MNDYWESETLWDEDVMENMFWEAKKKIIEAWEKGYDVDMDIKLTFEKEVEE